MPKLKASDTGRAVAAGDFRRGSQTLSCAQSAPLQCTLPVPRDADLVAVCLQILWWSGIGAAALCWTTGFRTMLPPEPHRSTGLESELAGHVLKSSLDHLDPQGMAPLEALLGRLRLRARDAVSRGLSMRPRQS